MSVSTLGEGGVPGVVERSFIRPPQSRLGPVTAAERLAITQQSPLYGRYDQLIDRESAYEMLKAKTNSKPAMEEPTLRPAPSRSAPATRNTKTDLFETLIKTVLRSAGSTLGRSIVRGLLGSILKR